MITILELMSSSIVKPLGNLLLDWAGDKIGDFLQGKIEKARDANDPAALEQALREDPLFEKVLNLELDELLNAIQGPSDADAFVGLLGQMQKHPKCDHDLKADGRSLAAELATSQAAWRREADPNRRGDRKRHVYENVMQAVELLGKFSKSA